MAELSKEEQLDLVSDDDQVIGTVSRKATDFNHTKNFRVINAFLLNPNREIWIPTRSGSKKLFPSHWDASIGGHVQSGEAYVEALAREAQEELFLDINDHAYEEVAYLFPHVHQTSAFMKVYVIHYEGLEVVYNREDIATGIWIAPEKALELMAQGQKAKGDLDILIKIIKEKHQTQVRG